jgi:hypothetical protein
MYTLIHAEFCIQFVFEIHKTYPGANKARIKTRDLDGRRKAYLQCKVIALKPNIPSAIGAQNKKVANFT